MTDQPARDPDRAVMEGLEQEIAEMRADLAARGGETAEIGGELGDIAREHARLKRALDTPASARETLKDDIAALRSSFRALVSRIDGRYSRPLRRTTGP